MAADTNRMLNTTVRRQYSAIPIPAPNLASVDTTNPVAMLTNATQYMALVNLPVVVRVRATAHDTTYGQSGNASASIALKPKPGA